MDEQSRFIKLSKTKCFRNFIMTFCMFVKLLLLFLTFFTYSFLFCVLLACYSGHIDFETRFPLFLAIPRFYN